MRNWKFCNFFSFYHSSSDIVEAKKSRIGRYASHAEDTGWMKNACLIVVGKPKRKNHLGGMGINGNTAMNLRDP